MRPRYSYVASLLGYDPESGRIYWQQDRANVRVGQRAGTRVERDGRVHISIQIDGARYQAARLIWLLSTKRWPKCLVGFRNGNPSDLRWSNLFELSQAGKTLGAKRPRNASKLPKGLTVVKGLIHAKIKIDGRSIYLGQFDNVKAARSARRQAVMQLA